MGAGRHAGARGPARLADDRRQAARGPADDQGASSRGVRADGLTDVGAARHGRLQPRARGLPPLQPARRRARCGCTCSTRPSRSQVAAVADAIDPATTLFIVSSKSGGTIEPNALLALLPRPAARPARTSSRSPTRARRCTSWPSARASATCSSRDPEIGGRYSALSPFGIVPAALAGVDVAGGARGRPGRGGELRAARRATPGCGSARRSASSRAAAATS